MIPDLVAAALSEDGDAIDELERRAAADPGALTPYLRELLDGGVLWPPVLYRAADDELVAEVVRRVDEGLAGTSLELHRLLSIIAHARGEVAEESLRRWRHEPPAGFGDLQCGVLDFAKDAGWVLHDDGTVQELCGNVSYQLVVKNAPQPAGGDLCPWCESGLWVALDLDTGEPAVAEALAHTGWSGRLRIATCFLCSNYTTLYSTVAPDGSSSWSTLNRPPSFLQRSAEDPYPNIAVVGERRPSPYAADAWSAGGSTLGGHPQWIQDPALEDCPGCGQPMQYVGLVGGMDLDEYGEGAYYLFLHTACGLAAISYQQS
jgi:hypothetical protein